MPEVSAAETVVITGAFSYTGKYATRLLLKRGYNVRTLTFHTQRENEFRGQVRVFPYNFENPAKLERSLRGASCLVNTYWVRFPHGHTNFDVAIKNTLTLFNAAKNAGIRRIVHVSIANPWPDSPLAHYRGKAQPEQALCWIRGSLTRFCGQPLSDSEDILINNIAWFVRHLPFFGVPGDGRYSIRPVYVEDMAELAEAVQKHPGEVIDAVGPETFTFEELVRLIAAQIGRRSRIVLVPAILAHVCTRLAGLFLGDVVLTWEEYKGLMSNLLAAQGPATGHTRLTDWLSQNRDDLGLRYSSEVARRFR